MTRHHVSAFLTILAMTACLAGTWGCQAGKTVPAASSFTASAAGPSGAAAAPGLSDTALMADIKPYLDCAYAAYVREQAARKGFGQEAARAACDGCSSLLEPFREHVYDRTGDKDYVSELTGMVRDHALMVMEQASAKAK